MKKTEIISTNLDNLENQRYGKSYLGKKVYSKEGRLVGIVRDILIDKNSLSGLFIIGKRKLFVDKEYIASESEKAIMLTIEPVLSIVGKKVFDSDGRKIGVVMSIDRKSKSNSFVSLMVKAHIFSKPFTIPKEDIEVCKENIILNRAYPK